jgi:hypothetical protein
MLSGLLADEYRSGDTFVERDETDKRTIQLVNGNVNTAYRAIHRARVAAIIAARELRRFRPTATADIAEMYMIKGYAEVQSGEHFCNGQPFSDASGDDVLYGTPVSTQEAFRLAVASLDSGLAVVGAATDARSTTVRNALRTLKGRAQINLGEFAAAGTSVADVPTTSTYQTTYSQVTGDNRIWELNISAGRYTVADRDGGNGLPFVTAVDPRVPICRAAAPSQCAGLPIRRQGASFDGATPLFQQLIWPTRESPVTVVSGVEARLIEAEAALRANNVPQMLSILNALRANTALYRCPAALLSPPVTTPSCVASPTALAPLTDPGTANGRQDLLFSEKGFWLFSTGRRLGDLRRLVRQYGRTQEQVFPSGTFFKGGTYGGDVNLPVVQAEENNPNFKGCTDRNA